MSLYSLLLYITKFRAVKVYVERRADSLFCPRSTPTVPVEDIAHYVDLGIERLAVPGKTGGW